MYFPSFSEENPEKLFITSGEKIIFKGGKKNYFARKYTPLSDSRTTHQADLELGEKAYTCQICEQMTDSENMDPAENQKPGVAFDEFYHFETHLRQPLIIIYNHPNPHFELMMDLIWVDLDFGLIFFSTFGMV